MPNLKPMILVGTRIVIVSKTKGSELSNWYGSSTLISPGDFANAPVNPEPDGKIDILWPGCRILRQEEALLQLWPRSSEKRIDSVNKGLSKKQTAESNVTRRMKPTIQPDFDTLPVKRPSFS